MKKANYGIVLVFLLLSAFVIYQANTFEQTLIQDDYVGASFFPELLAWMTAGLALFLGWLNFRGKMDDDGRTLADLFPRRMLLAVVGLGLVVAYALLLESLGFILATIALNAALLPLFGVRSSLALALFPVIVSLSVYVVFYKTLIVPLPEGLFYF